MITGIINCIKLIFETAGASFSPSSIDRGTLAMLSVVDFSPSDKVLDLGCGYGTVGIYAAKLIGHENIIMSDIDETNVKLAEKNAKLNNAGGIKVILSDGFKNIQDKDFTVILSNPPYNSDFSVAKHFIEKGFNRLQIGGKLYMVTKRKDWYKNKLTAIFGGTKIYEIDGYYIFCSEKYSAHYANKK
jgi:16S rRNA (guanine1207-N2)-methyltransferase